MRQIRIKYFGPIKQGFIENKGFLDIKQITILVGNQGTGKSCVAKLVSTLSWLEKALFREKVTEKDVIHNFINTYCAYQGLKNYFSPDTEIEYIGKRYHFIFKTNKLIIKVLDIENQYQVPKIMYIPAERNFLSVANEPEKLVGLPRPLYTFLTQLEKAQQNLSNKISIPISNIQFEYEKQNRTAYIVGNNYKILLSEASSGLQSAVPLFLVSHYLTHAIHSEKDASKKRISIEQEKKLKTEIEKIITNTHLSEEVKTAALELLSAKYINSCFFNIVEEIEQNLFPKSQKDLLFHLLAFSNYTQGNQLLLTTHSPYIINYLTLAIKAKTVWQKIRHLPEIEAKLNQIVPINSCIAPDNAVVYELSEEGIIRKLLTYQGVLSDNNYLNDFLAETNELFDNLLNLEEEI